MPLSKSQVSARNVLRSPLVSCCLKLFE